MELQFYIKNIARCLYWLVNSPSAWGRLGYHGVWIRALPLLPRVKELLLLYYVKLPQIFVYCSGYFTASWSHHRNSRLVPEYAPSPFRYHRWRGRPPFPLCLPVTAWCTPLWCGAPRLPVLPLTEGTPTLRLLHVFPSAPRSVAPPSGRTPSGPWASPPSPPISHWRTRAPTEPTPCTLLPGPAPLLPYFPSPLLPPPNASKISVGYGAPPPNLCCCRQLSVLRCV